MTDWDNFEARARSVLPAQELKPKRCWIGVLSHDKAPSDALEETSFDWMIGHQKITIQKIHNIYQQRHENVDFQIRFKDQAVDMNDTVKSFLAPDGDLVLFLACLPDPPRQQILQHARHDLDAVPGASDISAALPVVAGRVKDEPMDDTSSLPAHNMALIQTPGSTSTEHMPFILAQADGIPPQPATLLFTFIPSTVDQEPVGTQTTVPAISDETGDTTLTQAPLTSSPAVAVKHEGLRTPVSSHLGQETLTFNPEGYFKREPSPDQVDQEIRLPDRAIREVISQRDPSKLEAGVAQSIKVLQRLKLSFSHTESPDGSAWIKAIDKLIPQATPKRTIIGVVGNTGAGKSSVINAMLDEERLVPTNCMRACTAVVTEISFNVSTEPSSRYRAEIEFVTHEEWEKEVTTLMKEFLTEAGGLSRDVADENSNAGVAWAKFHSVYPQRTRDSLSECTVESLLAERSVLAVLGTTKQINTAYSTSFYQQLQRYVDSKEKVTKKGKDKDDKARKTSSDMEHWPLIKVVRIYVKAQALSTGAVIVDLPGVHDSNAARAAVAQGYMKQCTGLWIVAPINRAVDDRAAKTLLGESFKRQLKYDGGFSNITFICSKTDDISITEAVDSLQLEEELEELYTQQRNLEDEIEAAKEEIDELQESRDVYQLAYKETSKEVEVWEELQQDMEEGKTVYAPRSRPNKKRKKSHTKHKDARKRRQTDHNDPDDEFEASDDEIVQVDSEDSSSDNQAIRAPQDPLTEEWVKGKLKESREARKAARRSSLELLEKIRELKPRTSEFKAKVAAIKSEISRICIAGRNDYSKRAIQFDFAAGIKELDQENAAEDEDNFNPDEELRDYDEVAKSLPVFCVSSRAYQQMSGRLQKDDVVPGFKTPEQTEMPQLQAHCTKLTEAGRIQTARSFLLNLCQQLTTFSLWASDDGTGLEMADDAKCKQVKYLERRLSELETGLEDAVQACLNAMKQEMNVQIFEKYPEVIKEAISEAPDTAQKWGAHRTDGGLFFGTYKAVVRRDGQFHSPSAGHRDFNADLVNPIVKKLATGWERAFQNRLPKALEDFTKDSSKLLHSFHEAVEERARSNGFGLAGLAALKTQIYTYEQLFVDLNQDLLTKMNELQRDANRDFTPTIARIMHTAYDECAGMNGPGSYKRMKDHMSKHIDKVRDQMFFKAAITVQRHLEAMCKALESIMEEKADEIYIKMKGDYMRVLGGGQLQFNYASVLPKAERELRAEVLEILQSVDAEFGPIARGEFEHETEAYSEAPTIEHMVVNETNEGAFESVGHEGTDSVMGGMEDTMGTGPKLSEPVDLNSASEKEIRVPPTPSTKYHMYMEEEEEEEEV